MHEQPEFRTATSADGPGVAALIRSVLEEYGLKPDPDGTDADLRDIDADYLARGGRFWVLEADGSIVGSVGLYPLRPGVVELRKMYLHPSLRGQGWGRRMMALVLGAARADGYSRIELETSSRLVEAIAMYRRYGFRQLPSDPHAPRCDQAWALDL